MQWTGWAEVALEPRTDDLGKMGEGRSAGLHLSTVIHTMKVAAGERVGAVEGDQDGVRLQEGFLWERALEYVKGGVGLDEAMELAFKRYARALRAGVVKQLTVEKDGIHMTPDGLHVAEGRAESYKCTRRSLRKALTLEDFEANFWTWMVQEKSYCWAMGVDSVRWIVLWAAGDYSRGVGSGPRVLETVCTFTVDELRKNWENVLVHAEGLR
jgi:hypothetical protein